MKKSTFNPILTATVLAFLFSVLVDDQLVRSFIWSAGIGLLVAAGIALFVERSQE